MTITLDMYDACEDDAEALHNLVKNSEPSDFYFSYKRGYPVFALKCHADVRIYTDFANASVMEVFFGDRWNISKQELLDVGFIENNDIMNLEFRSYY